MQLYNIQLGHNVFVANLRHLTEGTTELVHFYDDVEKRWRVEELSKFEPPRDKSDIQNCPGKTIPKEVVDSILDRICSLICVDEVEVYSDTLMRFVKQRGTGENVCSFTNEGHAMVFSAALNSIREIKEFVRDNFVQENHGWELCK